MKERCPPLSFSVHNRNRKTRVKGISNLCCSYYTKTSRSFPDLSCTPRFQSWIFLGLGDTERPNEDDAFFDRRTATDSTTCINLKRGKNRLIYHTMIYLDIFDPSDWIIDIDIHVHINSAAWRQTFISTTINREAIGEERQEVWRNYGLFTGQDFFPCLEDHSSVTTWPNKNKQELRTWGRRSFFPWPALYSFIFALKNWWLLFCLTQLNICFATFTFNMLDFCCKFSGYRLLFILT